jgi:hypothetical protein
MQICQTVPSHNGSGLCFQGCHFVIIPMAPSTGIDRTDRRKNFIQVPDISFIDVNAFVQRLCCGGFSETNVAMLSDRDSLEIQRQSEGGSALFCPISQSLAANAADEFGRLLEVQIAITSFINEWFELAHPRTSASSEVEIQPEITFPALLTFPTPTHRQANSLIERSNIHARQ